MYSRTVQNRINSINETFKVLVVTGPRQVGKSTILEYLMPKGMSKITLDDITLRNFAKTDPKQFLETFPAPLFIDEVQYAPELFPYIKMLVDKNDAKGQYWLSGSQAFELMKGVTESLAGRAGIIKMNSFSYKEIIGKPFEAIFDIVNPKNKPAIDINELFRIIFYGGMPALISNPKMDRNEFYNSYVSTYIERDVKQVKDIGSIENFRKFMRSLAIRNGTTLNYSNIAKDIGVSDKTIKSWLSVVVNSGIVYLLEAYSSSKLKSLTSMPKIIFMDSGLACYLSNFDNAKSLQLSEEAGRFYEAFVVSEIIKNYENNGIRLDISHLRHSENEEIDIIIRSNNVIHPIEIKKTSSPKKEMIKNFKILLNTNEKIGVGGLICSYENLIKLDENNYVYPISSVIN